jgi:hypothetical protein
VDNENAFYVYPELQESKLIESFDQLTIQLFNDLTKARLPAFNPEPLALSLYCFPAFPAF